MECFSCKKSFDSTQLLSHVKDCYPEKEGSKNFLLKCNSSDCNKVFRSFNGLKLHLSSHTDHESNQENRERQIENDESEEESVDVLFKHFEDEMNKMVTMMCIASIPDSQQDTIIDYVSSIIEKIKKYTIANIEQKPHIATESTIVSFHQVQEKIASFRSKYLRQKNYQQLKTYVAPVEKVLTVRTETVHCQSQHQTAVEKSIQSTFQYIPIKNTLKTLFESDNFKQNYFKKSHECEAGVYRDVCCGSNVKTSSFFAENPHAIMIDLYYDEVEPCDALKQARGVHKLGQIYYRIRNLGSNLQTKLDHIYLAASFYFIDLQGLFVFKI